MSKGSHRPRSKNEHFSIARWDLSEAVKTGPWFTAEYVSTLGCCGDECEAGDEIRADGEGGYQGRCCYPGKDD